MKYTWERRHSNGYEVSSKGDKRFSALYAKPVFCGYVQRCDPDHPFYEDYLVDSYVDPNIRE